MSLESVSSIRREPWNKGRLIGQKRPLRPKEVWAIRVRLEIAGTKRNLALFNLAIDSKLRACDLVVLRIEDVCLGVCVRDRATIIQRKTGRPARRARGYWRLTADDRPTLSHSAGRLARKGAVVIAGPRQRSSTIGLRSSQANGSFVC